MVGFQNDCSTVYVIIEFLESKNDCASLFIDNGSAQLCFGMIFEPYAIGRSLPSLYSCDSIADKP